MADFFRNVHCVMGLPIDASTRTLMKTCSKKSNI
jgi:hypothetical protein